MEFLDLIESYRGGDATERTLFGGEGRRVGRIRNNPNYDAQLSEALGVVERALSGSRAGMLVLEEAMSTSDFPLLFGDILDRAMVGSYREYPSAIEAICRVSTVRDFRSVSRHAIDGAEGQLSQVGELTGYPETSVSEQRDTFAVAKYGKRIPISWETMINDDLDAFRDLPNRLGRGARRTEQKHITQLYVDASGPHASLYTAGHANQVNTTNGASADNPALSISAMQDAFIVLSGMTDTDGEPIYFDVVYLVVPPALEVTARNILNGTELRLNTSGGATNQQLIVANWMRDRVQLIVDPYIPQVATTANGSTSWWMFGSPSAGRAAIEFARLRGHEDPELWVKSPNAQRVGGGDVGPDQGDFDNDAINYRVRKVHGGAQLNNTGGFRSTVASNGSGS